MGGLDAMRQVVQQLDSMSKFSEQEGSSTEESN